MLHCVRFTLHVMGRFDIDITNGGDERPQMLDERMQEIVERAGYRSSSWLRALLLLGILYRLAKDRRLDKTLLAVLLASVGLDVGHQLYYQWKQGSIRTDPPEAE